MLLAGAGGHCRTLPDLQPGLYRSRRQQVSLDGPGEGDTMQGPGCQQGRGQQGAETLSREDGREPPPSHQTAYQTHARRRKDQESQGRSHGTLTTPTTKPF